MNVLLLKMIVTVLHVALTQMMATFVFALMASLIKVQIQSIVLAVNAPPNVMSVLMALIIVLLMPFAQIHLKDMFAAAKLDSLIFHQIHKILLVLYVNNSSTNVLDLNLIIVIKTLFALILLNLTNVCAKMVLLILMNFVILDVIVKKLL